MESNILIQMVSYFAFFFAGVLLMIFLTRGFLITWFSVLISRGKKILIQVQDPIQDYFITGKIISGDLIFKDRASKKDSAKAEKRIKLEINCIYRAYGVNCVKFNDEKDCLLSPALEGVSGFDSLKVNNLLIRALSRPETSADDIKRTITMIASIGALLIGCVVFYKLVGLEKLITKFIENPSAGVVPLGFAYIQNKRKYFG